MPKNSSHQHDHQVLWVNDHSGGHTAFFPPFVLTCHLFICTVNSGGEPILFPNLYILIVGQLAFEMPFIQNEYKIPKYIDNFWQIQIPIPINLY